MKCSYLTSEHGKTVSQIQQCCISVSLLTLVIHNQYNKYRDFKKNTSSNVAVNNNMENPKDFPTLLKNIVSILLLKQNGTSKCISLGDTISELY